MSHKIAHLPLDFAFVRSVSGGERKRHMTIELVPTTSGPNPSPVSQPNPPLPASPNEQRSAEPRHVVVQLALKIELPTKDIDNFKSSGAIVITLTPA